MNELSTFHQKANAAFLKVQKQPVTRDRVLSDIADSNTARAANMNRLRELRLTKEQQEADARTVAPATVSKATARRRTRVS